MSPDYRVIIGDSRRMSEVTDESVHLTVTSPPYPMVSIWDDSFAEASAPSYDDMHEYLNEAWREIRRALVPGGIVCINIGDATRTSNGIFHLYPNHSRTIENFEKLGFVTLPYVLWKKPTNRPHYKGKGAFLGSGFLPPNAYVTLDMEYILIFRKGSPRSFPPKDPRRYDSKLTKMFSILGDTVLDPFLGSGTTLKVAMNLDRKFVGYEKLPQMAEIIKQRVGSNRRPVEFLEQDHVVNELVG